jgi:hypothetical protein
VWDWDRRNNQNPERLASIIEPRVTFNWPYLDQTDIDKSVVAVAPALWYSAPQGPVFGVRAKTNYLETVDIHDVGIALSTRTAHDAFGKAPNFLTHLQLWARGENLVIPGFDRPLMGYGGGVNFLDGILKLDAFKNFDFSPYVFTPGPTITAKLYATLAVPGDSVLLPEQWEKINVLEAGGEGMYKTKLDVDSSYTALRVSLAAGATSGIAPSTSQTSRGYLRAQGSITAVRPIVGTASQVHVRIFGGVAENAPLQRAIFASSQDPFETFNNDLFRSRGAVLKRPGVNYLPLGGAGLRGYGINVPLDRVAAVNGEFLQRLFKTKGSWGDGMVSFSIFGDASLATSKILGLQTDPLNDAGAGIVAQGKLYDRDYYVRLDAPVFANRAGLAGGRGLGGGGSIAPRWTITVGNIW